MSVKNILAVIGTVALFFAATSANAIPAFARKYQTNCSSCHTAYPSLNSAGRKFKEAGYTFPKAKGEESISDFLHWDKVFPISAAFVSRPFDNSSNGKSNTDQAAIHEIELFTAGRMYRSVSGFFELEMEDEDGFNTQVGTAAMSYNFNNMVNAQVVWGSTLFADAYDTYTDARRLTASHAGALNSAFGMADNPSAHVGGGGRFRDQHQVISLYGRPIKQVYYNVGVTGLAKDTMGTNSRVYFGRLAVDVMPNIMIGGMAMSGSCETNTTSCAPATSNRDFKRYSLDSQVDIGDARITGVYIRGKDDRASGSGEDDNDAWYVRGLYVIKHDGRPQIVPLVRLDSFEKNDGKDDFKSYTLNVGYYFTQNVKGFAEFSKQFDTPSGVDEEKRYTLQFEAAF